MRAPAARRENASLGDEPVLRIGVPHRSGQLCVTAYERGLPVMVSASAFWVARQQRFVRDGPSPLWECDVALDSAGFTAMANWKRKGTQRGMLGLFPWTLAEYFDLVEMVNPSWWSQPDACVEPELAADDAERGRRLEATEAMLAASLILVDRYQQLGAGWLQPPVPVLQGWLPTDYLESLDRMLRTWQEHGASFDAPVLVGLGSMCRRPVEDAKVGIRAVLDVLLPRLPPSIKLHLFGVKSQAMASLASIAQVASFDSMAWDVDARYSALRARTSNTLAHRSEAMLRWYDRQQARLHAPAFPATTR